MDCGKTRLMVSKRLLLLASIAVLGTSLGFAGKALARWKVDAEGKLVTVSKGQVLSEGSEGDHGGKDSSSGGSGSSGSGSTSSSGTSEGTHETETKMEVKTTSGTIKVENESGHLKIKTAGEAGKIEDVGEQEELDVEDSANESKIRIASGSGELELEFAHGTTAASTRLPISVDLATNELIVTTPAGVRRVAVLPDQAISNLLANNILDEIENETEAGTESAGLQGVTTRIKLVVQDGTLVYKVEGASGKKFLGLVPIKIHRTVHVSAQTGELLQIVQDFRNRLLDFLSV